jgi:UDP-N-acetylmuramate--alanine ligase
MLAELMRLKWAVAVGGTHGKTTTTSLIAAMLDTAGYDPTVINGGIINAYGTNARLGAGEWMVVEADESDGTFVKLPSTIAVVTNIDPEHMEFYGTFDRAKDAFRAFVENIPFYGFAVLCIDHPEVQALIGQVSDRRLVTYGFSPQAEIRATDEGCGPDGCRFSVVVTHGDEQRIIEDVRLPMYGEHNMLNSLAAMAVGLEMGIDDDVIVRGLSEFEGVKRRFTRTGKVNGVTIIDDYGHHPVEITAVLKAARTASVGQVVAVVQPHRYTRLQSLFEEFCACFNDADTVIVADVYPAGESPIPGIDRDTLIEGLRSHGHRHVEPLGSESDLARIVSELTKPGDMVVCLGAGTISAWANALPGQIAALDAGADA